MIRKLFNRCFLVVLSILLSGSFIDVDGQGFTIPSPIAPNRTIFNITNLNTNQTRPVNFVTFDIKNDNPCDVALDSIDMYHLGRRDYVFPPSTIVRTVSTNYATYELYGTDVTLTGNPLPIVPNWDTIARVDSVFNDTLNEIIPIFKKLNVVIPANSTMRFLIQVIDDTMETPINGAPASVTVNGVTLTSGSQSNTYIGNLAINAAANSVGLTGVTTFNFEGRIGIRQLPPSAPEGDVSLKPANKCIGDSIVLKATHPKSAQFGGTFTWKDRNGNTLSQNQSGEHTIKNLQTTDAGKYYVTYTNTLCNLTSASDSIVIIINDPPPPTVSGKFDYCLNEQFQPVTVNGTNPKWYYDPTGGSPVPVTPTINTSSPNTLIYYVSQTDKYGCESGSRTLVRFRAAPEPAPPIVSTPVYYCEEVPADQLTAIGDTLRWYYFPVGGVPTDIAPTPNTSVNDSFQYYVTQTIDGCESERQRIDVVVTFKPNGQINIDKEEICAGDSIVISYFGSAFDGSQYLWTLPTKGAVQLNEASGNDTMRVRLDTAGIQEVKLRVGNVGCYSDLYVEEVEVKPLPTGKISVKQDVCIEQPELIEAINYTSTLDSFIWDFDGGLTTHFTTDQGPYGIYWMDEGEKIINVTFIDEGCIGTASDTIIVHPEPNATITAQSPVYVPGDNNTLGVYRYEGYNEGDSICTSDSLRLTVQDIEPGATYSWTPARFFDTYSDQPVTYARVDFTSKLYVKVEDIYGCINEDSLEVNTRSCCQVSFPNAFSPNNDGLNDLFRPVATFRNQVESIRVLNRFGQVVYETAQSGRGWDGSFNGKPADVGTYFYMISFDCEGEKVIQSGEVILVR